MVRLTTVTSPFHARVIAARVGCEGIPTELRGSVDGPYPMGDVHVYVPAIDLAVAQELLLADEVESVFEGGAADDAGDLAAPYQLWMILAALLVLSALFILRF